MLIGWPCIRQPTNREAFWKSRGKLRESPRNERAVPRPALLRPPMREFSFSHVTLWLRHGAVSALRSFSQWMKFNDHEVSTNKIVSGLSELTIRTLSCVRQAAQSSAGCTVQEKNTVSHSCTRILRISFVLIHYIIFSSRPMFLFQMIKFQII